ncbi:MAG: hypothetical protein HY705_02695 [Gemmatimonadetes bacterium]|nr:hypothetical protein [Gemmatimonadota bacterium]
MLYALIPVVVAVVCISLGRRLSALVLILGYLSIEGFLKLVSNYNRVVHVGIDLVVLGVAASWALGALYAGRAHFPRLPWLWLIGLHATWLLLQLFSPYSPGLIPSIASYKVHLAAVPLYFIAAAVVRERRDVLRLFYAIVVICLVPFVTALLQYALGPASVLNLSPRAWANVSQYHEWRPFGTSPVPGGASVFAFLATPLAMVLLVVKREVKWARLIAVVGIALAVATFVVSGVRQMILACALVLLTMAMLGVSRGRGRAALALMVVVILGAGAYVGVLTFLKPMATEAVLHDPRSKQIWRERSVLDRLPTLLQGKTYLEARRGALPTLISRARRYPFGAGLGRTGSAAGALQSQFRASPGLGGLQTEVGWSDNFFADMIVETGIPGALMLTTILIGMMIGAARLARSAADPVIATSAAAIAGLFLSYLAMSWGSQPLMANPFLAMFWVFSGVLAAMRRMVLEETGLEEGAEAERPALTELAFRR